jgi:hypothetical protein
MDRIWDRTTVRYIGIRMEVIEALEEIRNTP